jgi:phosphatidylglycerol---prolipoprotein diacylglyceryl transferase
LFSLHLPIINLMFMSLAFVHWHVNPEIFNLGFWGLRYYSLLFVTGIVLGYIFMKKIFNLENLSQELLDRLAIYVFFGTVFGARFGHCIFYEWDYYKNHILEIILPWKGTIGKDFEFVGYQGLASHGGAIGIVIALLIFSVRNKISLIRILDYMGVVTPLAGVCIRLGNLFNSEIYGVETSLPWGFIFELRNETVPKHPTQLYEALSYLIIFFVLYRLYLTKREILPRGFIFGWFLILLFSARFLIEFIKEVQVDFESHMSLNMGQWLSLPFILTGVALVIWSNKKLKTAPEKRTK